MATTNNPDRCDFCDHYLTIDETYAGQRCVDPAHWQAAGQFTPHDFYKMARLMAGGRAELNNRPPMNGAASPDQPHS